MTLITFQNGSIVMSGGKVGTEQACCCGECCENVVWHRVHGACNGLPDDFVTASVDENCYAYYTWDDWDCQNALVGRDCGGAGVCNIFARVKITGNTPGTIEYLQSTDPDVWGTSTPGGFCDCPDSFGSLSVLCGEPGEPGDCPEGIYVNGPEFTWEWNAGLGGWELVPPEDVTSANQACQDFADANGLLTGGAAGPIFAGAFDGEQVTVPSCVCGS